MPGLSNLPRQWSRQTVISCNFRAISRGPRGLATPNLRNLPLPARNFTRGLPGSHLRLEPFDEPRFARLQAVRQGGGSRPEKHPNCRGSESLPLARKKSPAGRGYRTGDASRTGLLDFDLRPGSFYLLLDIFGLLFGHAFLHCFRRAFDKSFRFRQA